MIILGIDPGSTIVGYSIIKKNQNKSLDVIDFGCILAEQFTNTGERLQRVHTEVDKLIKKYKPDLLSIETLFFFKNLKTVMPVSQSRGVILLAAAENKTPILEFTPLQVKMTVCGYGRAQKKQIKEMIKKSLDLESFDMKKNYRKKDDAFDALGLAMCAAFKNY